jgi:hypothetical protein
MNNPQTQIRLRYKNEQSTDTDNIGHKKQIMMANKAKSITQKTDKINNTDPPKTLDA